MENTAKRGCVLVNYVTSKRNKRNDLCVVKEHVFHPDGRVTREIRQLKNYKRDFYVTAEGKRNHQSKKEWERIRFCQRYECNQAQLIDTIANVLRVKPQRLRILNRNPYLYGTDVDVTSIIKNRYDTAFPDVPIMPTAAYMDYEWRIHNKELVIGTMVFEEDVYLTVDTSIFAKVPNYKEALQECFQRYLVPYINDYYDAMRDEQLAGVGKLSIEAYHALSLEDKHALANKLAAKNKQTFEQVWGAGRRSYKLHVIPAQEPIDVTRKLFAVTHEHKPDYLVFWNGESDMGTIDLNAKRAGVDMASFLADPSIPEEFRQSEFVPGQTAKLDANGNEKKIKNHERWHVLQNPASWQFLDLMCTFASNRAHLPQRASYSLDDTLWWELKLRKFKFNDHIESLGKLTAEEWHNTMLRDYPIEYCIYAAFDVIGPQILEDKTADIRGQFYPKLGVSPIGNFKKNPRRICDKEHFALQKKGYIIGSTSDKMFEPLDAMLYTTDGWIITLQSDLHYNLGAHCLEGLPEIETTFVPQDADGDIRSSYPSNERLLNMCKTTTCTELFKIDTVDLQLGKEIGMNIAAGRGCAIDVCYRVYGLPHLTGWIKHYRNVKEGIV